jgi:acyl-CoA synthetase (AMP-forming)/AMP-acid ligase II
MGLQYIGDDCAARDQVISAWEQSATVALVPEKTSLSRDWIEASLAHLPDPLRTGHFCLLSSGTTGAPRLFVGSKKRAESLARALHRHQQSEPVEETILALPLSYSYALVNQFVWARVFGRRLVPTPGFARPEVLISALANSREAMLCLVGPQAKLLARACRGSVFPGVMRLHFAGSRFPQELLPDLHRMFPNASIFNNYGCVEAMPRLTIRKAEEGSSASDIGVPITGVELSVRPDSSLIFRSPYSAVAYSDPSGARELPADEWLPTGDLASLNERGNWQLLGRAAEVFKRYGEKIALPQILSGVSSAWEGLAGTYRDKDGNGEDGYVLVIAPHPEPPHLQGLLRVFRRSFQRSHWPLRIESIGEMPVSPNGKINPAALPQAAGLALQWRQRL